MKLNDTTDESASDSDPSGNTKGVYASPATISSVGRFKWGAADGAGRKLRIAVSFTNAVMTPVWLLINAPIQLLPLATPISPRPAARNQDCPWLLLVQTPPLSPEPVTTRVLPSSLIDTVVADPMASNLPAASVSVISFQLQLGCLVSAR